ncbi:hypothetical protein [Halobacillus amylolyticus]|uniref:Uncharacterized protein n=1 Tax=Halobacillus amylolyticus TaxID=2932259 RepID=A0ABY4HF28_9BACI|nr:hypothetical protein [Halobacillus amylolyticus]UOR12903.1 hypothetical protein MUO15_05190 [Halobacillus amylolyticus]
MGSFAALLIILLAAVVDFFWIDVDRKRWGWMKNWSKFHKVLFFSGFIAVSIIIYVGLSLEYI